MSASWLKTLGEWLGWGRETKKPGPAPRAGFSRYVLLLAALGLLLLALGDRGPAPPPPPAEPAAGRAVAPGGQREAAARALEAELEEVLQRMEGVGAVRVFVTLEGGPRRVLAETVTREDRTSEEGTGQARRVSREERVQTEPVTVRRDDVRAEEPVVLWEQAPRVRGVLVVAAGAADARLRLEILQAVAAALDLPAHRVAVTAGRP